MSPPFELSKRRMHKTQRNSLWDKPMLTGTSTSLSVKAVWCPEDVSFYRKGKNQKLFEVFSDSAELLILLYSRNKTERFCFLNAKMEKNWKNYTKVFFYYVDCGKTNCLLGRQLFSCGGHWKVSNKSI